MAYFQQSGLQIILGEYGKKPINFDPIHRASLYFGLAFLILGYILMRGQSAEDKHLFFTLLTYSAFVQYFYKYVNGLAGLPFHLCNAAVVLMFGAHVFKLRGVYYFTYFVNVLGALFALMMPSLESDAFELHSVHFWYNHIYAVVLPLLGVALHAYERPTLKMMYKAIGIFTLYFVTVVFVNAWFNNYEPTDFFFIYENFFTDKLPSVLGPLKLNYVLEIPVGDITLKIFYLFQPAVYVAFVVLMFVMWILYDYLYKVSDRHYELLQIKRKKKMDMLNIQGLRMGQKVNEPLNKEALKMIKIENFTKQYAGSKKPSVENLSLEIHAGEVYGFLGHNGAGKSTTIK
jgi:ABC-2 type transport system ATP-binding protein